MITPYVSRVQRVIDPAIRPRPRSRFEPESPAADPVSDIRRPAPAHHGEAGATEPVEEPVIGPRPRAVEAGTELAAFASTTWSTDRPATTLPPAARPAVSSHRVPAKPVQAEDHSSGTGNDGSRVNSRIPPPPTRSRAAKAPTDQPIRPTATPAPTSHRSSVSPPERPSSASASRTSPSSPRVGPDPVDGPRRATGDPALSVHPIAAAPAQARARSEAVSQARRVRAAEPTTPRPPDPQRTLDAVRALDGLGAPHTTEGIALPAALPETDAARRTGAPPPSRNARDLAITQNRGDPFDLHVSIGRIEVRSNPAPTPVVPPRASRAPTQVTLAEYLRARQSGRVG
jgi:hypothetical protein